MVYLTIPFILQGILMSIDEVLHMKRGLGTWERLGHPLDTFTVFVPLSFIALNEYSIDNLKIYGILSVFSCFFITKDEFVHSTECTKFESWLHSVLFILHPMIFFCSGFLWKDHPDNEFLSYQPLIIGIFMIYQILKWSIPWKKQAR